MAFYNKHEIRDPRQVVICRRKVQFKDKRRASWRAHDLNLQTEKRWRHYRCDECGKYHLTTKHYSH